MEDKENVQEEVVASTDEQVESSTTDTEVQESENQTPEESVVSEEEVIESVEEEQTVPYDRFREVNEEKKFLRDQITRLTQKEETPQTKDPYANMDPETERFWRAVDQRAEAIVEKKLDKTKQTIDAGRHEIASIRAQQFYKAHPDIKKGSPEATEIAQRIQRGYDLEDAYWAVMGQKGIQKAEQRAVKKVKQNMNQKKQANTETSSVSPDIQKKAEMSFEDEFKKNFDLNVQGKL